MGSWYTVCDLPSVHLNLVDLHNKLLHGGRGMPDVWLTRSWVELELGLGKATLRGGIWSFGSQHVQDACLLQTGIEGQDTWRVQAWASLDLDDSWGGYGGRSS